MRRLCRLAGALAFGATVAVTGCRGSNDGNAATQGQSGPEDSAQQTWGSGVRNDGATRSDATSRSGTGGSGLTGMGSTEQMDSNSVQGQAQPEPKQNPTAIPESR